MEIEKVIRIVSSFIAVAAFAICILKHILFPESSYMTDIPIAVLVILSLYGIWTPSKAEKENSNK